MMTLFFLWKLLISTAMSCSIQDNHLLDVMLEPTTANLAVVGIVEEKGGELFFKIKKHWTAHRSSYEIDQESICSTPPIAGKSYLYLSANSLDEKIDSIKGVFYEISKAGSLIKKLENKVIFDNKINPSFQYCETDSQCVGMKNECNELHVINIKYENKPLITTRPKSQSCAKFFRLKGDLFTCLNNFCQPKK